MRRALGILGESAAPLQPQPGAGELRALVDRTREAGLVVELDRAGRARARSRRRAGLTVYRVAQEALTNVLKHAGRGASATVALRWEPDAVTLVVRDDGGGAARPATAAGAGWRACASASSRAAARSAPARTRTAASRSARRSRSRSRPDHDVIRVFLVDDQALVRAGLKLVIDSQPDMTVVGEAGDGRAALEALAVTTADVVLMDVRMPVLDGVAATARLIERDGDARAARGRAHDVRPRRVRLLRAPRGRQRLPAQGRRARGAARRRSARWPSGDAVVAPSATRRLLEQVARAAARRARGRPAPRDADRARARRCCWPSPAARRTPRSATELYMAEATVKTHVGRLLAKLDARDRVQLVVFAYEAGLVRSGA